MTTSRTVLLLAAAALTALPGVGWAQSTETVEAARAAEMRAVEAARRAAAEQVAEQTRAEALRTQQALEKQVGKVRQAQEETARAAVAQAQAALDAAAQPEPARGPFSSGRPKLVLNEQLNIEFGGGSLQSFLDLVRESRPSKKLNVIVPANADKIDIPPLTLSRVEVPSVLEALEYASAQNGRPMLSVTRLEDNGMEPVFALRVMNNPRDAHQQNEQFTCVISLNQITKPQWAPEARTSIAPEVVLTAIETAIAAADQSNEESRLKFHQESGLLIVRGTDEQITAARSVISSLESDVARLATASLGDSVVKAYALTHVPAAEVADSLRLAFPPDTQGNTSVAATADTNTNSLVVKAPSSLQVAASAIIRVIDRAAAPDAEAERAKMRAESMMRELEVTRERLDKQQQEMLDARAAAAEYKVMQDNFSQQAKEAAARAMQARDEALRAQNEARANNDQREALLRTVNEQRAVIEQLRAELAKQPK